MWPEVFFITLILHDIHSEVNLLGLATLDVPLASGLLNSMSSNKKCERSVTIYTNGQHPCKNQLIFEDQFEGNFVNKNKWIVEQYTPITSGPPDYEFVSYEANDETLFVNNSKLFINPVPLNNDEQVKGTLDLRDGCTSSVDDQCFYQQVSAYILPPVKSAKISSKFSFTYGKIEVKAKLPVGDWIYPQIQLLPRIKSNDNAKMWIAYSRGNSYYIGADGDVGCSMLFGGLVLGTTEPGRSRSTSRRKSVTPYGDDVYIYTLIWEPDLITVQLNNETYGVYPVDKTNKRFNAFANEFYMSIGVGVGGINDFPDNYISNNPKPWINTENKQLKKFFDARNTWLPTWKKNNVQLQIDSIKIWAL